jgi:hypothetical protein
VPEIADHENGDGQAVPIFAFRCLPRSLGGNGAVGKCSGGGKQAKGKNEGFRVHGCLYSQMSE